MGLYVNEKFHGSSRKSVNDYCQVIIQLLLYQGNPCFVAVVCVLISVECKLFDGMYITSGPRCRLLFVNLTA